MNINRWQYMIHLHLVAYDQFLRITLERNDDFSMCQIQYLHLHIVSQDFSKHRSCSTYALQKIWSTSFHSHINLVWPCNLRFDYPLWSFHLTKCRLTLPSMPSCMSSQIPLYRLATLHFDECYTYKQSDSTLSQLKHTIWVSRCRTLRSQYLHLGIFLWKQYIILASYKELIVFVYVLLNMVFLSRHLPTEIVIFIKACYQINDFIGDSFSIFWELDLLISYLICWVYLQFLQGIQWHQNILNSTFEAIYQVPR